MSLENEEYISVFFRSVKDKDQECFTMAKFRKKNIGGETKYFFCLDFQVYIQQVIHFLGIISKNIFEVI